MSKNEIVTRLDSQTCELERAIIVMDAAVDRLEAITGCRYDDAVEKAICDEAERAMVLLHVAQGVASPAVEELNEATRALCAEARRETAEAKA